MSIDHHAPDTAGKHGLQRNVRMHSNTGRRRATTRRRVDLRHIRDLEVDEPVLGEHLKAGGRVDHNVDQRYRPLAIGWRDDRRSKDRVDRIEATLVA